MKDIFERPLGASVALLDKLQHTHRRDGRR
jgi:hypothetical protein